MKRFDIPVTPRHQRYVEAWARSPKPPNIPKPGPGQESVWDYPRPPAVEEVDVLAQVFLGDLIVAESNRCLRVLETSHPPTIYFPCTHTRTELLVARPGVTFCEWKGNSTYFDLRAGDKFLRRAAWRYSTPLEEYAMLANYVSFYPGAFTRCTYNGETVQAQPGDYYAGWVTSNLVGPFKGGPGSKGW